MTNLVLLVTTRVLLTCLDWVEYMCQTQGLGAKSGPPCDSKGPHKYNLQGKQLWLFSLKLIFFCIGPNYINEKRFSKLLNITMFSLNAEWAIIHIFHFVGRFFQYFLPQLALWGYLSSWYGSKWKRVEFDVPAVKHTVSMLKGFFFFTSNPNQKF